MNVGYLIGRNDQIDTELIRNAGSWGFGLSVVNVTDLGDTVQDALSGWLAPVSCVDDLLARGELPELPLVLIPANERETFRAIELARPIDEVCGVSESAAVLLKRARRTCLRHAVTKVDALTGLLNRASFGALFQDWQRNGGGELAHGLFMLDLDHFKSINDRHGHMVGDDILQQVAVRLRSLPGAAHITRFGGEEFVFVASMSDVSGLAELAESARAVVEEQTFAISPDGGLRATASVGWTVIAPGEMHASVHSRADMALYHAKSEGRNRAVSHHGMSAGPSSSENDVELLHFQNVAKVVTERTARLVSLIGKGMVERARTIADRDPLTGAWNRGYLDRRLAREIDLSRRDGRLLAIALMDLDHFGRFNKQHGTPTGDAVLREFVRISEASLRTTDWLARYGGEEFVLVIPGTLAEACLVAERLRAAVETTSIRRPAMDGVVQVTVSIGVAAFEPTMSDADTLFQRASDALNEAKHAGRNRVLVAG